MGGGISGCAPEAIITKDAGAIRLRQLEEESIRAQRSLNEDLGIEITENCGAKLGFRRAEAFW